MNKERELLRALAQMLVNKFHAEYPEGTQPGDATRLAMGYLNLLAETAQPEEVTGRNAARYLWLRENGEQGIYVLRDWKQGDPTPPLELAQGAELDAVIDEYLSGKRKPQPQPEG